jgi:serine/threonine protein kinase
VRSTSTEPQSLKAIRGGLAADCGWKTGHHVFAEGVQAPFVVLNFLGMGSLGVVEELTSRPSPENGTQTLARKRVLLPYHGRHQRLQIIKEEAKVLEDLAHQHIIQIIASYEDTPQPGKFFYSLLMSPVGDNDLKTFLDVVGDQDRAPQEKSWLRQWFSCLTAALAYLHGQGVRHQDIKPSNIIHRDSHIFFTDFSSSSRFEVGQTTSTENPARTSAMYGAPEAIDVFQDGGKLKKHGRAADIFSLGAVFSEMLSVIDGRAVNKYHEFLSQSHALTRSQGTEAARGLLLYGRSVHKATQWFSTSDQRNVRGMFADFIAPMLRLDREDRPEAIFLLDLLATQPFTSPCHCQFPYSSRRAGAALHSQSQQEGHQPPAPPYPQPPAFPYPQLAPAADDASERSINPSPQVQPSPDRWAQIRRNAAERAARLSEEQSRMSQSQSARTDEGESSGEETIESRVARIKARVAELTGNMDGQPAPSTGLRR